GKRWDRKPGFDPKQLPAPAGVTFSDTASATEPCKPCTQCEGLQSMSAPCVETDDAVCRCAYGYFQDEASGSCRECRVCEAGFGLMFPCKDSQDTVCEECPEGTFSSEANFVDPCLPCTTCEENEVLVRECTPVADAECRGKSRAGRRGVLVLVIVIVIVTALLPPQGCSWWNSCKQNKQGANNRPVNQTPSPEGEKLHSDSGISVDSQSLHDQQPPGQGTQGP
uniref:tumor necrosis factor receptor superfamily member 16-like n=1 Tax=Lonchura striata TaxID=40157 RepID=UPI00129345DB